MDIEKEIFCLEILQKNKIFNLIILFNETNNIYYLDNLILNLINFNIIIDWNKIFFIKEFLNIQFLDLKNLKNIEHNLEIIKDEYKFEIDLNKNISLSINYYYCIPKNNFEKNYYISKSKELTFYNLNNNIVFNIFLKIKSTLIYINDENIYDIDKIYDIETAKELKIKTQLILDFDNLIFSKFILSNLKKITIVGINKKSKIKNINPRIIIITNYLNLKIFNFINKEKKINHLFIITKINLEELNIYLKDVNITIENIYIIKEISESILQIINTFSKINYLNLNINNNSYKNLLVIKNELNNLNIFKLVYDNNDNNVKKIYYY